MAASVNDARRGEGGRGDNRGSAAKIEFWASILNVIAGLIDLLRSALLVGTPRPTGPTPKPMFRAPLDNEVAPNDGELAPIECEEPRLDDDAEG